MGVCKMQQKNFTVPAMFGWNVITCGAKWKTKRKMFFSCFFFGENHKMTGLEVLNWTFVQDLVQWTIPASIKPNISAMIFKHSVFLLISNRTREPGRDQACTNMRKNKKMKTFNYMEITQVIRILNGPSEWCLIMLCLVVFILHPTTILEFFQFSLFIHILMKPYYFVSWIALSKLDMIQRGEGFVRFINTKGIIK